jgi:hypothetical protein
MLAQGQGLHFPQRQRQADAGVVNGLDVNHLLAVFDLSGNQATSERWAIDCAGFADSEVNDAALDRLALLHGYGHHFISTRVFSNSANLRHEALVER